MQHPKVQAIIVRESDGLRFEPCFHPGMVRCEACLELVEPSQVREHVCVDWWSVPRERPSQVFPPRTDPSARRGGGR